MFWAYLAGLATLPLAWVLLCVVNALLVRNLETHCRHCNKKFGSLDEPRTLNIVTNVQASWHERFALCERKPLRTLEEFEPSGQETDQ